MKEEIKFVHTNIIAKDWKKLAQFYIDVFGCEPVYPERNLKGEWIDQLTGIKNAQIRGIHLKLPGNVDGPTLEIFEFAPEESGPDKAKINRQGFGHIAFLVEDIDCIIEKALDHGAKLYGSKVEKEIEKVGLLTAIYISDPEGNIVELQNWKK